MPSPKNSSEIAETHEDLSAPVRIVLSERDYDFFISELNNPTKSCETLIRALRDYRKRRGVLEQ